MGCCGSKAEQNPQFAETLSKLPIIWVLGGPGSGKGTQCARLVEKYGFNHLSSGDLLREEVASGSKRGEEINNIMVKGELVSKDVILDLLKIAMLRSMGTSKGFLIDGFPREIEQAIDFEEKIYPCTMILYFDCSDEVMKQRILTRAQTSGRLDDNEGTIVKRLQTFHSISEPVISKYNTKVTSIPGDTDPDTIFEASCQAVDKAITSLSE